MDEKQVLKILGKVGAIITDSHIVYTSGKHGSAYVNKDALYPHTEETSRICRAIAERFADDYVEAVVAPAIGGVVLTQWIAHHLSQMNEYEVLAAYAEKTPAGDFVIKRGYDKLISDKRVLVVEDVLTTGNSARATIDAVRATGGNVIGLGVLCNRGEIGPQDVRGVPKLTALATVPLEAWDPNDCPLCMRSVAINIDVGKGREFLAQTS